MEQMDQLIQANLHARRSHRDDYTTPVNVAIYGRVSTQHTEQLFALDNQMEWYQLFLKAHPNWNVVQIYSESASGTNTYRRKAFNKMIDDGLQGKF